MRILVGDLSRLYGLTNQTLHYYEDRGILVPKRDVITGYRYYESEDLQKLGTIKKYRNAGFALNDGVYDYNSVTCEDVVNNYARRRAELEREIDERRYIIAQLDWDMAVHKRYTDHGDTFMQEELGGFLRFESRDRQIVFQEETIRREAAPWFKSIFFTASSEMWYDDGSGHYTRSTYGMIADLQTAERLGLPQSEHVQTIPAGMYVTRVVRRRTQSKIREQLYEECVEYADRQGYIPRGNMFTRFVFLFTQPDKGTCCYTKVFLPVQAKAN